MKNKKLNLFDTLEVYSHELISADHPEWSEGKGKFSKQRDIYYQYLNDLIEYDLNDDVEDEFCVE